MSRYADSGRDLRLDPDSFAGGYFRNAVYRHWDPYEDIPEADLQLDRERLVESEMGEREFDNLRSLLALFGAGEEAVTEDLAPMMLALDNIDEQLFISSQVYEEAKHTQFFDRYWRTVIDSAAEELGIERTSPLDERYFGEHYEQLFDKTEAAMHRLLEDASPEAVARAICHYHLVVESVLAQTGYYSIQSVYSDTGPDTISLVETPNLPGLVGGITRIRSDEGRHVGFGMNKVQRLIHEDGVDPDVVQQTLQELMPHVAGIITESADPETTDQMPLMEYSRDKLTRRIEIITSAEAEVPPVEELVQIEGAEDVVAD
jgi:ribonucleoside-diphosphate reductase beta chain